MTKTNTDFWDEVKAKYVGDSTEDMFGIDDPPDYQCKKIDSIRENLEKIEGTASNRRSREDFESASNALDDIEHYIFELESDFVDIADTLELAREWGQQWKDLAKRIIEANNIDIAEIE